MNDLLVASAEVGRKSEPSDFAVEGWLLGRGHQSTLDRPSGEGKGGGMVLKVQRTKLPSLQNIELWRWKIFILWGGERVRE